MRLSFLNSLFICALFLDPRRALSEPSPESVPRKAAPLEIVLVEAKAVTPAAVDQWKREQFHAVAVVVTEPINKTSYRDAARHISDAGLDLFWWIEVARNPRMATEHPGWMAALGTHPDWQKSFPRFPEPGIDQVAKAYPWVPIGYSEAFEAHLTRIEQWLRDAPPGWKGILLNDLQGGPSSCGCGNVQCRWALDYHVPSTTTKLKGDDLAARFTAEVRKRAGDKSVIPVWTTECAEVDLPPDKHRGLAGTGFCGSIGCATAACPEAFTRQLSALAADNDNPIGLLAVHSALQRNQPEFGGGPGWMTNAISYVDQTLRAHAGQAIASNRLWVVVEGLQAPEEKIARALAVQSGVGAVIVARLKIDQSYEPKMFRTR